MRLQTLYYEDDLVKLKGSPSLKDPRFDLARDVQDWRGYVGKYTRQIWSTLTDEQRAAIALDCLEKAGNEDWP